MAQMSSGTHSIGIRQTRKHEAPVKMTSVESVTPM